MLHPVMDVDGLLFLLIFAAAAVVIGLVAWHHHHKRREALSHLALDLGWVFYADGVGDERDDVFASLIGRLIQGPDARFRAFGVFDRGRDRRAYNTLQGSLKLPAPGGLKPCPGIMGDYRYTTGSGKNKKTHHFSYLILELPLGPVPETIIRPEGFFDQIAGFMGFDDIDFESAEFSDAFHVKGADKRFAYDLCHPRMMQFLLATRPEMFEIDRFHICVSAGRGRWSPEAFKHRLLWVAQFLEQWPRHVVDRLSPRPTAEVAQPWGVPS